MKDWSALALNLSALCGALLIAHGVWRIYQPAGEIVAGIFIFAAAFLKIVVVSK